MHGKEQVVAPIMAQWFGLRVERAAEIDTDALGAFTGEIERKGSMLDAARAKARLAIERTGAPLGFGSEGAFGPHPIVPILPSGLELMVLIDSESNHEIAVHRRTGTNYDSIFVPPGRDLSNFLARIGFPEHAVIVRPENSDARSAVVKGIVDREVLHDAIESMAIVSASGRALVQTDMRAHLNPTRMKAIRHVAKALALRIARLCPACGSPGFGLTDIKRGLLCEECGSPTNLVQAEVHACERCGHKENKRERPPTLRADPTWCNFCNP
jgi:ribosomal protein L37E